MAGGDRWGVGAVVLSKACGLLLVGLCALQVLPGGAQVISGILVDSETDTAIPFGDVATVDSVMTALSSTKSDLRGRFTIEYTAETPVLLYASALSYRTYLDGPFRVVPGDTLFLEFRLDPQPLSVDSIFVSVEAREQRLQMAGFYQRRRSAYGGAFLEYKDLEDIPALRASDYFMRIPGVSVVPDGGGAGRVRVTVRNGCSPNLFVDGVKLVRSRRNGVRTDEVVRPDQIVGIEVFRNSAQVPSQYDDMDSRCGAILIWTH